MCIYSYKNKNYSVIRQVLRIHENIYIFAVCFRETGDFYDTEINKILYQMAKNELKQEEKLRQQNVDEAVSKTEQFFNQYKTVIVGCLCVALVAGLSVLAYSKFYLQPKKAEAAAELFRAEQSFAAGEYELALTGDDNNLGLRDIVSRYGDKAGEAVYLYAGVSELSLGNFEDAIKYLKKYDGEDHILLARAQACIGDAYVGLEQYKTAISYFEKAAETSSDVFSATYLLKAGVAAEEIGDKASALAYYKKIKDQYPQSVEGMDIDKYITRIESAE